MFILCFLFPAFQLYQFKLKNCLFGGVGDLVFHETQACVSDSRTLVSDSLCFSTDFPLAVSCLTNTWFLYRPSFTISSLTSDFYKTGTTFSSFLFSPSVCFFFPLLPNTYSFSFFLYYNFSLSLLLY